MSRCAPFGFESRRDEAIGATTGSADVMFTALERIDRCGACARA